MAKALDGIRVLDLTHALNGPFCTMLLGYMGAEVIKLEYGTGDRFRKIWLDSTVASQRDSYEFQWVNINKKGITLNLRTEKGKEIFRELVRQSDVLVENFSAGTLDRLGFTYENLCEINPRLIYASGKGFGISGPYKNRHSAATVAMGMGGWTHAAWSGDQWWNEFGRPDPGTKVIGPGDEACGVSLAVGILGALFHREQTGKGQKIEVSMQEAIVGFLVSQVHEWFEKRPVANAPSQCADGYYTFTGVLIQDDQWKLFAKIMDREDLTDDTRFATSDARQAFADELHEITSAWMKTKTRQELWELLEPLENVNGPVLSIGEVVEDPHMRERGAWQEMEDTVGGTWPMLKPWIHMSETPCTIDRPAPVLGEYNEEIYSNILGYTKDQVAGLRSEGVI